MLITVTFMIMAAFVHPMAAMENSNPPRVNMSLEWINPFTLMIKINKHIFQVTA